MLTRLLKRKLKSKISQNSLLKTPNSTRALYKTYKCLHTKDYINNETAVLIHADKKFIIKNKVLRKKNKGLRGAIFRKKAKI